MTGRATTPMVPGGRQHRGVRRPGSSPWTPLAEDPGPGTPPATPGGGASFRDLLGPVDADTGTRPGLGAPAPGVGWPAMEPGAPAGTAPFAPVGTAPFAPAGPAPFAAVGAGPFAPVAGGPFTPVTRGPFAPVHGGDVRGGDVHGSYVHGGDMHSGAAPDIAVLDGPVLGNPVLDGAAPWSPALDGQAPWQPASGEPQVPVPPGGVPDGDAPGEEAPARPRRRRLSPRRLLPRRLGGVALPLRTTGPGPRRWAVPGRLNSRWMLAAASVLAVGAGLGGGALLGAEPQRGPVGPTTPEQCEAIQAAWTVSASHQVGMTADDPATLRKGFLGARDALADAPTPSGAVDDWAMVTHYLDTVADAVAAAPPDDGDAIAAAVGGALADLDTPEFTKASARITEYLAGGCAG